MALPGTLGDSPSFLPGNAGVAPGAIILGGSAQLQSVVDLGLLNVPASAGPRTVTATGVAAGEVPGTVSNIHNLPDGKLNTFST